MSNVHNQRLEKIIGNMVDTANEYALEGNLEDSMVITQAATELYNKFDKKYTLANDELKYRLALAYSKLATIETLRELSDGKHLPRLSQYEYERTLSKRISKFCMEVGINFTVLTLMNWKLNPTDQIMEGLGRLAPSLSSELREQYKEWFDYVNVLNTYFGTFCGKRDLTDSEKEILERFKSKYYKHTNSYLPQPEQKVLPDQNN